MIIENVKAYVLRLPTVTDACDGSQDTALIEISTDEGVTGWGEVDSCPTVVKAIVEAPLSHMICNGLRNILVGLDPLAIDDCMYAMYEGANYYGRTGAGAHAMAGVNIALWDIAGKVSDKPIYQVLGQLGEKKYRAYCSILFGDTPAETYDLARRYVDQGFTAIKFGWGPMGKDEKTDIELVHQARRGAGDHVEVMVDAGQVWDWKTALRRAEQFADYSVFWLEEPLHPEDISGYAELTAESPIPIATGEAESDIRVFQRLVTEGGLDWIQPDPGRCGISTFVEAGRFSANHDSRVANHSFKSGITIAASLHALAAVPNGEMFEYCMSESPLRHKLTKESFDVVDGYITVPETPGLGISIDETTFEKYRIS